MDTHTHIRTHAQTHTYSHTHTQDQYSEYSPMMDDGPWNQVQRPSGHHADKSGLVSGAYWDTNSAPGHIF